MISYFTKQFQAVPALMGIYNEIGGQFVSTRSNTIRAIEKVNVNANVVKYTEKLGRLSRGHRALKDASLIVTGAPYSSLLKGFSSKKYMIFTGTSPALTTRQIREDHAHFDKLCAIGPRMMRVIERSEAKVEAVLAGYFPFLSFPEKNSAAKSALMKFTGLNEANITLVYLPRGEPNGSIDLMLPKMIEAVKHKPYNLIVRPHPSQSVKLHLRDRIRFLQMQRALRAYPNIYLDLNYLKLSELLSVADLVISDGNSPAEEALFYDTPQIVVESHRLSRSILSGRMRKQGSTEEDVELAMRVYDNGPIVTPDVKDILLAAENALVNAAQYANNRHANFEFVFGERVFSRQHAVIDEMRTYTR